MSWGVRMQYKTIGEICTVVSGTTPKSDKAEYWGGNLIWITPAELKEGNAVIYDSVRHITKAAVKASALKPFPKGTVILSSRAPIGKVAIAGTQMYCNQGFKNLICSEVIYNGYLYYYLKAKTAYLNSLGRGATFREISKQIVEKIKIPVPSMQEQHRIADILFKIDALMGKRQQQAEKLDELVKARFVEMFGDPVRNCLHTAARPMTEICQIIDGDRGKNYPKADDFFDKGDCLFLNAKNVTKAGFNFDECMFITKDKDNVLRKGKLQRGDIILTTRGTIGNLAFYTDDVPYSDIRINSGMVILRMNREYINPIYFIEQFKMQLENIKRKIASGTAQPQLPISTMNKIKVIIPDIRLQANFANFVHEVDREKERIQRSAALLETLKRSLMQQYFG